jgi:hypothetical protein
LEYDFDETKTITKYTITSRTQPISGELPKDWTFEAWDEQSGVWVVLDTRSNVSDWQELVRKEFTFTNTNSYYKYRINITSDNGYNYLCIGELEMMETVTTSPTNLKATAGDAYVTLSWDAVTNATSYNIKRSTTSGTETLITSVTGSAITFNDSDLTNGTTYYYVVSAVNSGGESANSNEVSATPEAAIITGNAILDIVMDNGTLKEYNLTGTELDAFLTWYDNRSNGTGNAYYIFTVKGTVSPYTSVKHYIPYNKILYFDLKSYDE